MGGQRPRARLLALAAALAAPALYARWMRPRLLSWGATRDEAAGAYPGDELIPDPDGGATMATTLPGPPERVWPWLVQMGGGRGGWYSWDRLDNDGAPSADRIVAQWQSAAGRCTSENGRRWPRAWHRARQSGRTPRRRTRPAAPPRPGRAGAGAPRSSARTCRQGCPLTARRTGVEGPVPSRTCGGGWVAVSGGWAPARWWGLLHSLELRPSSETADHEHPSPRPVPPALLH
jgi:hypothetical protein